MGLISEVRSRESEPQTHRVAGELNQNGFALTEGCLSVDEVSRLIEVIQDASLRLQDAAVRRRTEVYAVRNLVDVAPLVLTVFANPIVRSLLHATIGEEPFLTRAILFDKTTSANWHVAWHQDLSVAVKSREDIAGWNGWSLKAGVPHVQPPVEILERMVTMRMHLDSCHARHGALRIIAGSHRNGRLPQSKIEEISTMRAATTCEIDAGGVLLFKPLLLHSSPAAEVPGHRRVVHFEFSPLPLPLPLAWRYGPLNIAQSMRDCGVESNHAGPAG